MCNTMVSYFKRNQKVQRNKRQNRSEQDDPSRSDQADQSKSVAIRVEPNRDGESILEQIELRGMIRLKQSGVTASGEKHGRSDQSENITERYKSRSKRENKGVVRRSELRMRKVLWNRADQVVYYRTAQSEDNTRPEKVGKQQRQSTWNDGI